MLRIPLLPKVNLTGILQKSGNVAPSFTSNLMESFSNDGIISAQDQDDIKSLGGMIFGGQHPA
jgi:hypothetical protein